MPVDEVEIVLRQDDLTPWCQEIVAHLVRSHDGEDEMQVRMLQVLELQAGGTSTAAVLLRTVGAVDVLGVRQCQLQLADTADTGKQLGVRYTSLAYRLTQLRLRSLLSYNLAKKQFLIFNF